MFFGVVMDEKYAIVILGFYAGTKITKTLWFVRLSAVK